MNKTKQNHKGQTSTCVQKKSCPLSWNSTQVLHVIYPSGGCIKYPVKDTTDKQRRRGKEENEEGIIGNIMVFLWHQTRTQHEKNCSQQIRTSIKNLHIWL